VEGGDGRAFYAERFDVGETGGRELGRQLVGVVEIGVGETVRVVVTPAGLERLDALALDCFAEPATTTPLEQAGVPVDACGNYQAAWPRDARGFGERLASVGGFDQVVERAKEERDVDTRVRLVEVARIADNSFEGADRGGLLDMFDNRVDQCDAMAV